MLDVTDNIVAGKTIRPPRVLARDDDDPYLVVAADKGTASFSDVANGIAAEYDFWLGDAFASGGSAGYDHKKMAITARGAWEAAKRHLRESRIDPEKRHITVIGIGDMSGDVFGNGMLLSPSIKLVAAFNHLHVFLDPDPNPEASFLERRRLFDLPRSGWSDYDTSKLSAGGGIYSRQSKSIELHSRAQAMLGLSAPRVTPPELIKAILTAKVDLLWNGGIGTYVKASTESHSQAADPVNDSVRVDANMLACRIVVEGGNLGFTQAGRIEYALAGGRINTDFLDNSGGVDCSDREVNIKILLRQAIDENKLTRPARNRLLTSMADEVTGLVLATNYAQTQAVSMTVSRSSERLGEHARLMRVLESRGLLDRRLECLPTDEQIEERRKAGRGLTRPELAVILSYAKIELTASLAATDIPEDPYLAGELKRYFPKALSRRFGGLIARHRLRRDIIAMLISSSMVNRMGPFFVLRAEEETGADVARVARAYAIVRGSFQIRHIWQRIEALDGVVPAEAQYESMFEISRMVRHAVYWFLQRYPGGLEIEPMVSRFQPGASRVLDRLRTLIIGRGERHLEGDIRQLEEWGLPDALAERLAPLAFMTQTLDIIELAEERNLDVGSVAELYFELGRALKLDWISEQIETLRVQGRWRAMARATLRDRLAQQQRALLCAVLERYSDRPPREALDWWLNTHAADAERIRLSVEEIQASGEMDFAILSVALTEVSRVA
jgi:glutamate dehydrogenase